MKFTFDGHGINDASNEYKPRVATLQPDYKTPEVGNLMAAAPELLKALIALMYAVEASGNDVATKYGWPKAIKLTREAIAKATISTT